MKMMCPPPLMKTTKILQQLIMINTATPHQYLQTQRDVIYNESITVDVGVLARKVGTHDGTVVAVDVSIDYELE